MRPYVVNERGALAPDAAAKLYVGRQWTNEANGAWRLMWARPGADSFCYAEGECSARHFKLMRDAIAHGRRAYGEAATIYRGGGFK